MVDKKISAFTDGGNVQTTDAIAAVRSGANVKVNFANLVPYTGATSNVDLGTYDLITDTITADSSAGLILENVSGGDVLHLGSGGGVNATAYGGWNFDGNVQIGGSSSFASQALSVQTAASSGGMEIYNSSSTNACTNLYMGTASTADANIRNWGLFASVAAYGDFVLKVSTTRGGDPRSSGTSALSFNYTGGATFANTVSVPALTVTSGFTATNLVTNASLAQAAAYTFTGNYTGSTANKTDITTAQAKEVLAINNTVIITGVNFNSANTDNAITLPTVPPGFTRFRFTGCILSGFSGAANSATFGLFTSTGGGGTALVASGTACTITSGTDGTGVNVQVATLVAAAALVGQTNSTMPTVYFRTQTAHGSAVTGNVMIIVQFLP